MHLDGGINSSILQIIITKEISDTDNMSSLS